MSITRSQFLTQVAIASLLIIGSLNFAIIENKNNDALLDNYKISWERSMTYMIEVAEAMPEEHYTFRPTGEIRTFGEQMLHVAQGIYGFASNIKGERFPVSQETFAVEDKTKEEIISILKDASNYSSEALKNLTQSRATEEVPWGGRLYESTKMPVFGVVQIMHDHTTHHRGQSIIYLRLKGITPPTYVD